jgi:hypothetical protein
MTKYSKFFAITVMAASLITAAVAQQQGGGQQSTPPPAQGQGGGGQGGGQGRPGMMSPDAQVEMMTKELGLSAEQQTKIKDILTKQQADMKALRDSGAPREEMMPKMREIRENSTKAINAVLTADQQKKYAEMQEKMRQGGGGPRPGGPGL